MTLNYLVAVVTMALVVVVVTDFTRTQRIFYDHVRTIAFLILLAILYILAFNF